MPIALTITRDDYTAAELREAATHSNDADATRRMLALALVLEGYKRGEAGKLCGMDRQTLRDWVLRYNAEGIGRVPLQWPHVRNERLPARHRRRQSGDSQRP